MGKEIEKETEKKRQTNKKRALQIKNKFSSTTSASIKIEEDVSSCKYDDSNTHVHFVITIAILLLHYFHRYFVKVAKLIIFQADLKCLARFEEFVVFL